MKRGVVLLTLSTAACLTFRPAAPPPGAEAVEFLTCRTVSPAGELLAPEGVGDAFGMDSESVYSFVKLSDVGRDTWLRWKWYGPDGKLARDSGQVFITTHGQRLDTVTAFDRLDFGPDPRARRPGAWTVVLFVEQILAEQTVFFIESKK